VTDALFDAQLQAGKTSLVRALVSPSCKCSPIDLDDRTVGIDRYDLQLLPVTEAPSSSSPASPVFIRTAPAACSGSFGSLDSTTVYAVRGSSSSLFSSSSGFGMFSPGTFICHPLLSSDLLQRIESSDSSLTRLQIIGDDKSSDPSKFLGASGSAILARSLSMNTCITSLSLFGNKSGSEGGLLLLCSLTHLKSLTLLNLNCLDMPSSGAAAFSNMLSRLTSLTHLELEGSSGSGNKLGSEGLALLMPAVAHLAALKYLNLGSNAMSSAGIVQVARLLTHLSSLSTLRLFSNCIMPDGVASLTRIFHSLTTLTNLDLSANQLTADDGARICGAAAAAGMTRLTLNLNNNPSPRSPFSAVDVIKSKSWKQMSIPQPSHEIVSNGYTALIQYISRLAIDAQIWDLAGQDVYTLSHAVHFSHRCLYLLLWKPHEPLHAVMLRVGPWLESLCAYVPDAHVVLVASHCKTNISEEEFSALSGQVEAAARAKIEQLNGMTRLEVDKLRAQLTGAGVERQRLEEEYAAHASSTLELTLADSVFTQQLRGAQGLELFVARAAAGAALPRSLCSRAADVERAMLRERLLCERLQLLLGIRNGASPDDRAACKLTLHCKSVDSVEGHGVMELRGWLHDHCRSLPFMGEMISSNWTAIAEVFKVFGDSVLSRSDAIALVRQHLPPLKYNSNVSDDEIWSIIEFWSLVGRIFVHETQVVRDPSTLIALLKPLLHHQPLQMMRLPVYQNLLVATSLQRTDTRDVLSSLLNRLDSTDELPLQLLDHLSAWKDLSGEQRSSMLAFFESSRLLCRVNQRPDVRLITSRVRSKPHLTDDVDRVTAGATYHALYLLPLNHIALIAHLQSTVCSLRLEYVNLESRSGRDSLVVSRMDDPSCSCVFSVESFVAGVEQNQRFSSLCSKLGDPFSCVLRVASSDFGMFKFAAACADAAIETGSFGTRHQCWVTVTPLTQAAASAAASGSRWTMFRDSSLLSQWQSQQANLSSMSLSRALQRNHHEHVLPGQSIMRMFQPRSNFFLSHAWGDGTGEFIQRLKAHLEQKTMGSVWVDTDGLNQQQETLIPAFRDALCQARVVFVVLTPTYLTRPNCLRELRWALDFEHAGHLRVVLLSLHPAVTFDGRVQLVQDGPLKGLVFSSKERKVKRLCPAAISLVERLIDVHMNLLPWHELQAWRSDAMKDDWEEHRRYMQGGVAKCVHLAGRPDGLVEQTVDVVKDWLVRAEPRSVCECAVMDDTRALSASDVTNADDVLSVLDLTRYPEQAAATLKSETEKARLLEEEAKKKAEEEKLKAQADAKKAEDAEQRRVAATAVATRAFRRRCFKAASIACMFVLLLLLRAGRLPLWLQRPLASLLLWLRR
jgi:hypothetical protein